MNQEQLLGLVRHVLTAVGGVAVSAGYIDSDTAVTVAGALSTLIGVAWSIYAKRHGAK